MKHIPMKLGPLALLLAVVSVCLTVLAILSFATARADLALAERYAGTVRTRYDLEREGQRYLATAEPGTRHEFWQEGMRLTVTLDEDGKVTEWAYDKDWTQEDGISGLWTGE